MASVHRATSSAQGKEEHLHHWLLETDDRVKNGQRKNVLQEAHLLTLPVCLQLNYLSHEMDFPPEKTGRHRHTCSGENLHKHLFSATQGDATLCSGDAAILNIFTSSLTKLSEEQMMQPPMPHSSKGEQR